MTLRLKAEYHDTSANTTAKIYYDSDWQEYRVKFYDTNNQHLDASDYHTDDEDDAHNTAGCEHPSVIRIR